MEQSGSVLKVSVLWRGNKYVVEMNPHASLKELGDELWKLTNVKEDTMRFIVPQNKSSKLLSPFSNDHASLSLQDMPIIEGKPIRMMGVSEDEVERILQNEKVDLRIVGFEEEEKRLRQRMLDGPRAPLKLPQGPYIFCNFHTLEIPGVELNPPASEALKIMHMLAADPGIVAIMNKHQWRVGKMTELAPVGYVGISPKCILGFNKNQGEEISLRLRTDDLKGFRKYESIKKTLLHELAHMVYSEHDANFYALDKQLNQEAATLDWTKSTGHTLSGAKKSDHYENFYVEDSRNFSQKLGGNPDKLASARASSVAAAYRRLANSSTNGMVGSKVHEEPDPGDSGFVMHGASHNMDMVSKENLDAESSSKDQWKSHEPDPDDHSGYKNKFEPDPDDSQGMEALESGNFSDFEMVQQVSPLKIAKKLLVATSSYKEPDPDDSKASCKSDAVAELHSLCSLAMEVDCTVQPRKATAEPDPDDLEAEHKTMKDQSILYKAQVKHDPDEMLADRVVLEEPVPEDNLVQAQGISGMKIDEPDPDDQELRGIQDSVTVPEDNLVQPQEISGMKIDEPDPDDQELRRIQVSLTVPEDNLVQPQEISGMKIDEPDPDDQELRRIKYSVNVVCSRLQKSIEMLRAEVNPMESTGVLHTLFKIIRNVIEHPDEVKYKRLRKGNPIIQRNVANYKAAIEILYLVGFNEDVVLDEIGKAETYLVLKRNDPGLLWLAKSSLETCIAY